MAHRVLVAEDEPDLQFLWCMILERAGYETLVAESGPEALEMARSAMPDVILLDGHLPRMTGWEVRDALASEPATARIAVVMLSGDTSPRPDTETPHLTKPVDAYELIAAIRSAIG